MCSGRTPLNYVGLAVTATLEAVFPGHVHAVREEGQNPEQEGCCRSEHLKVVTLAGLPAPCAGISSFRQCCSTPPITYCFLLPLVLLVYVLLRRAGLRAQNRLDADCQLCFLWLVGLALPLGLLFGTTLNDYLVGLGLERTEKQSTRRGLILLSIGVNLGVLGFFKYYNFFVASFIAAFAGIGVHLEAPTLKVILPVGISFYTFQALTYTIAVYRREMRAVHDSDRFFFAYVAFFPQLVAGPIERARPSAAAVFSCHGVIEPEGLCQRLAPDAVGLLLQAGWLRTTAPPWSTASSPNTPSPAGAPSPAGTRSLGQHGAAGLGAVLRSRSTRIFSGYSHIALGDGAAVRLRADAEFLQLRIFSQSHPEFLAPLAHLAVLVVFATMSTFHWAATGRRSRGRHSTCS